MTISITQNKTTAGTKQFEQIVVVQRAFLEQLGPLWQGIQTKNVTELLAIIKNSYQIQPRGLMENDPSFKQIIPYLVVTHQGQHFVLQRRSTASEQRLANKLSLGVGGHLRQTDLNGSTVLDWAMREWREEVTYQGTFSAHVIGLLNDERDDVGTVHLGCVIKIEVHSPNISVRSELKSGSFMTFDQCMQEFALFESWSQLLLSFWGSGNC